MDDNNRSAAEVSVRAMTLEPNRSGLSTGSAVSVELDGRDLSCGPTRTSPLFGSTGQEDLLDGSSLLDAGQSEF